MTLVKLLNSFLTNQKKCWPKGRRFMNYQKKLVSVSGIIKICAIATVALNFFGNPPFFPLFLSLFN
jgi:hypothetical protein